MCTCTCRKFCSWPLAFPTICIARGSAEPRVNGCGCLQFGPLHINLSSTHDSVISCGAHSIARHGPLAAWHETARHNLARSESLPFTLSHKLRAAGRTVQHISEQESHFHAVIHCNSRKPAWWQIKWGEWGLATGSMHMPGIPATVSLFAQTSHAPAPSRSGGSCLARKALVHQVTQTCVRSDTRCPDIMSAGIDRGVTDALHGSIRLELVRSSNHHACAVSGGTVTCCLYNAFR